MTVRMMETGHTVFGPNESYYCPCVAEYKYERSHPLYNPTTGSTKPQGVKDNAQAGHSQDTPRKLRFTEQQGKAPCVPCPENILAVLQRKYFMYGDSTCFLA